MADQRRQPDRRQGLLRRVGVPGSVESVLHAVGVRGRDRRRHAVGDQLPVHPLGPHLPGGPLHGLDEQRRQPLADRQHRVGLHRLRAAGRRPDELLRRRVLALDLRHLHRPGEPSRSPPSPTTGWRATTTSSSGSRRAAATPSPRTQHQPPASTTPTITMTSTSTTATSTVAIPTTRS